ncbi:hypothetical protein HME9302_01726 [Alteripontixanthobacter maritimus]|uniref:Response regulatory domain-containing protein n=1 Tax=Alteripontixanthobacter maritimus TaxID=2161824 RepID=A0A369QBB4_9SPHN|nr:response regulator [Alteripontixanthobacter maritimus]RDC60516.1 hypothetical protein HME9302_01726 [Alteripontixanthobacter maritimus]
MSSRSAETQTSALSMKCVVVVEDDAILAMSLEQALTDAGVEQVIVSSTTDDAIKVLRSHRPEALVLDVHLADRDDGWAIAELVQNLGPRRPRVVFSTGAPDDIPPDIAELGPVLTKPYDSADLIEALSQPAKKGLLARLKGRLR